MRRNLFGRGIRWLLAIILAAVISHAACAEEYRDLFNGKDLDGWVVEGVKSIRVGGEPQPVWSIKDGLLTANAARGGFGFLRYTKQEFGDFVFRVEYRMTPQSETVPRGNSGIGIRTMPYDSASTRTTRPSFAAYEIQLMDDAGTPPHKGSTGSLYRYLAPTVNATKPAPAWNIIEIECIGPHIRVTLNDKKVIDVDQTTLADLKDKPRTAPAPRDKSLKGYVCLQSHTGRVEFRKVQIREIKSGR